MPILERASKLRLTRPLVLVDTPLSPKVRNPLPDKSGFAMSIVGPAGSGKTSTMISLVKARDGYKKRFESIITVIPASSLDSLKSNPFRDLDHTYEELDYETLEEIIETVEKSREEDERTLLIFDDISAELQDAVILKKMMRLFLNRRHLLLSIIVLSHSLTGRGALPYTVRKNVSHMIIFKPSAALDVINTDYLHLPRVKFKELTDYVFDVPHSHLMIVPATGQLYKNFNKLTLTS